MKKLSNPKKKLAPVINKVKFNCVHPFFDFQKNDTGRASTGKAHPIMETIFAVLQKKLWKRFSSHILQSCRIISPITLTLL